MTRNLSIDFQTKIAELEYPLAILFTVNDNDMQPSAIKQFKSNEAELILLRLQLSNIKAEFWLDMDGLFNYCFTPESGSTPSLQKSSSTNWSRIDEVISQMAYDAAVLYPDSAFASWYNEPVEFVDDNQVFNTPRGLMAKVK